MTPRTMENEFSELLKAEDQALNEFDLRLDGPLLSRQHPRVLWAKLQYENNPEQEAKMPQIPEWNFEFFKDLSEAKKKYPQVELHFYGQPWAINKFLSMNKSEAIIDFLEMGTVMMSKKELTIAAPNKLHHHVLSAWMPYALSPELWGPVGKWIRFHQRLHDLFLAKDLLAGEDSLGYYPLRVKAEKLSEAGFYGTHLDKTYLFVLPWTFSLTALDKLEKIVQQEF